MRSRVLRTMAIAAVLSVFAEAASIIFFTKTMVVDGVAGFSGTASPEPMQGLQVLADLISNPSFGASVTLPQLAVYFIFTWAAALLGTSAWTSGLKASAVA